MKPFSIPWSHCPTLGEYIMRLVKEKKTDSEEFKQLIAYHGRDKLIKLYNEELKKQLGENKGNG